LRQKHADQDTRHFLVIAAQFVDLFVRQSLSALPDYFPAVRDERIIQI
jgi:hypothetical protein